MKFKGRRRNFGVLLTNGLNGIEAYLLWNPDAQDSEMYPELCWHNHVGMTWHWTGRAGRGARAGR